IARRTHRGTSHSHRPADRSSGGGRGHSRRVSVTWLLDVSALVAHLVQSHEHHSRVNAWWPGRALAVCPITELGFLRVACALGSTMEDARTVLAEFLREEAPALIPCDRHALD